MQFRFKFLPTLGFILLSLFATIFMVQNQNSSTSLNSSSPLKINDTSLIFYRAYWEQLDASSVRIRIFAFSKCFLINSTNFLTVTLNSENGHQELKLDVRSIEPDCPWHWASACKWNSFVIDSITTLGNIENNNIIITNKHKSSVTTTLIKSPDYEDGLSVCVPPLYWYSDWLKLSLFIEIWKQSGAKHFYFYVQSISKNVEALLKEYESQKIVTIIEWPLLPNSTEENPNESIYRFGHLVAQNDCRYRIQHRFGVVVDVDELILPLKYNLTLVDYLKNQMKTHPLAGSFTFKHSRLHFPLWPKNDETWNGKDLSWMDKVTITDKDGPTKAIFISDRTDLISTHKIRKHLGIFSEVEIPLAEAKLLHFRRNWTYKETNQDYEFEVFKDIKTNISFALNSTLTNLSKSLPKGLKFNHVVGNLINSCLSGWQKTGCKTPFISCYDQLETADDWIIYNSTQFTVL